MKRSILPVAGLLAGLLALPLAAKLPAPSDEAKAKAAETAAKTAHGAKVDNYKLCLAMDRVAAGYQAAAKKAGKAASAPTETPACADPGPFVYTPAGAASAPAVAAPAASAAVARK
ncbi:MAG: hypothetical protein JNL87_14065 [Burkholderiaceae bacterium]|nr:hypothetical protein [Burkholderiaceae bacterium]